MVCDSVLAGLMVSNQVSPLASILAALWLGAIIGLFNGFMITRFRIPSFVVTLAGSLTLVGLQLYVLGGTGTVNLGDNFVTRLTSTFFSPVIGWTVAAIATALTLAFSLLGRACSQRAGLLVGWVCFVVLRIGFTRGAFAAMVIVSNPARCLPVAV